MTIFSLSLFDEKVLIENVLFSPSPKSYENEIPEIEIRIGSMKGPRFDSSVPFSFWNFVYNYIVSLNIHTSIKESQDIVSSKGPLREIKNFDNSIQTIYQKKIKDSDNPKFSYSTDLNFITEFQELRNQKISFSEYTFRLAKAYEIPIKSQEYNLSLTRPVSFQRNRTSVEFKNFIIDFTERISNNYSNYEIEIEFKKSFVQDLISSKNFITFTKELKNSISLVFPSIHTLFSSSSFKNIKENIENYIKIRPKEKKPVNIQTEHITDGFQNYSVTNKLDGVGYNIIFVKETIKGKQYVGTFLCNSKDIWKINTSPYSSSFDNFINSISKCEVRTIPKQNEDPEIEINIYDCIMFDKDITNLSLKERYEICEKVYSFLKSTLKNATIKLKQYFYDKDFNKMISQVIQYMYSSFGENIIKFNDGVIFQYNGDYKSYHPLKWKFPSLISIDFSAKFLRQDNRTITYTLLSNYGNDVLKPFVPDNYNYPNSSIISFNKNTVIDNYRVEDLEGFVLECIFDTTTESWKILRIRFDKSSNDANFIKVANSTFQDMILKTTLPQLVENVNSYRKSSPSIVDSRTPVSKPVVEPRIPLEKAGLKKYRELFNQIKSMVIKSSLNQDSQILDIGAGKGGDLPKYVQLNNKINYLFAVEPSSVNIKEFNNRLQDTYTLLKQKTKLLQAGGQEYDKITSFLKENNANITNVFMFYSMSFFFKDFETLYSLVNLVGDVLKNGNLFSGTMMDGHLVRKQLLKSDIITNEYSVKKVNINDIDVFGQKIVIDYKETQTATEQYEYLSFFNELQYVLASKNLFGSQLFSQYSAEFSPLLASLSPNELNLAQYYCDFQFKKDDSYYSRPLRQSSFEIFPHNLNESTYKKGYWYRGKTKGSLFESILRCVRKEETSADFYVKMNTFINDFYDFGIEYISKDSTRVVSSEELYTFINSKLNKSCFISPSVSDMSEEQFNKIIQTVLLSTTTDQPIKKFIEIVIDGLVSNNFERKETEEMIEAIVDYLAEKKLDVINTTFSMNENKWIMGMLAEFLKLNIILVNENIAHRYMADRGFKYIVLHHISKGIQHIEFVCKRERLSNEKIENIREYQTVFNSEEIEGIFIKP
jgi:hypothetical protein